LSWLDRKSILQNVENYCHTNSSISGLITHGSDAINADDLFSDLNLVILSDNAYLDTVVTNLKEIFVKEDQIYYHTYYGRKFIALTKLKNLEKKSQYLPLRYKVEIKLTNNLMKIDHITDCYKLIIDKKGEWQPLLEEKNNHKNNKNLIDTLISGFVEEFETSTRKLQSYDIYNAFYHSVQAYHNLVQADFILENQNYRYLNLNHMFREEKLVTNKFEVTTDYLKLKDTLAKQIDMFDRVITKIKKFNKENTIYLFYQDLIKKLYNERYFINFRDVATINPDKIKSGLLYRSHHLIWNENDMEYQKMLKDLNISKIIDLRHETEKEEIDYKNPELIENIIIRAAPRINEPLKYTKYGDKAYFYEYSLKNHHSELRKVLVSILQTSGSVILHCYSGKDRTGIVVLLLFLLIEIQKELIIKDYLSSRKDTSIEKMEVSFKVMHDYGGINEYLQILGLTKSEINSLKNKFSN
jgi:protein-tyrosine phosphatase